MVVEHINGGEQAFEAMLYKPHSESTLSYINNNIAAAADALGSAGSRFIDKSISLYNQFNNSALINATKAFIYGTGTHMSQDMIYPLYENNMHEANLVMQRYIMANPVVSNMHKKNMCDGWSETFFNQQPDAYGKDRYDYMRVMDGILQHEDNEEEEGDAYIMHYTTDDDEEDLDTFDKFAILDTWHAAEQLIYQDIDPTSSIRESL